MHAPRAMAEIKGNEKLVKTLTANVRAPEKLILKLGAKVMFVKNNMENGYINGTVVFYRPCFGGNNQT